MAAIVTYPKGFPCASRTSYGATSAMGLQRTPFEAGNARQRRIHLGMPHMFRIEFVMTQSVLGNWQPWVNQYGYNWFELELASYAADGQRHTPHTVRFASDLELQLLQLRGLDYWRVGVDVEWIPAVDGVPIVPGGWIISNRPATAATDWIIGGTPAAPSSSNWIRAGKPERPSSLV